MKRIAGANAALLSEASFHAVFREAVGRTPARSELEYNLRRSLHWESMLIEIEREDDVCVLHLSGRFASGADPEYLRAKSDEIRSLNCTKVLADLSEVPSMGSTGIGFVVGIYSSVTKKPGGRFVMVGAAPRVRAVFDLTHLSGVIPSAPDVSSGMAILYDAATALGNSN